MNKISFVFIFSVLILLSCNRKKKFVTITSNIEYDVIIETHNPDLEWWVQNIEENNRKKFLRHLLDGLKSEKLKAYSYDENKHLNKEQLEIYFNSSSADYIINVKKLRFIEKWSINGKTMEMEKKVMFICPVLVYDSMNEKILFKIKQDTNASGNNLSTVTKKIRYDVDFYEEEDNNIKNSSENKMEEFAGNMLEAAYSGKFKTSDYFDKEVSGKELKETYNRNETISVQSPQPPYEMKDTIISINLDKNEISRIRFMEEWFIDDSFNLIKKVLAICPVKKVYEENGEVRGYMPLFWIHSKK